MSGPRERYTKELYDEWGYLATWVPNAPVRLGDVGLIRKHEFQRTTSLADLGVPFSARVGGAPADYNYVSRGSVTFRFKAAGEVPVAGSALNELEAGVTIEFGGESAVAFGGTGAVVTSIADQKTLGDEIIRRYLSDAWPSDQVVVTELIKFRSATILVSDGAGAQVELGAAAGIGPDALQLASLGAGTRLAAARSIQTQIVGVEGLTPLFRACAVKKPLIGAARFRPRLPEEFSHVGYDATC